MWVILKKEISAFFRSVIGYLVMIVFLLMIGMIMWVFPDTSVLYYPYASLSQFFDLTPYVFLFLIPAITMRAFAEEYQNGTLEWLSSKPLNDFQILSGKFLSSWILVIFTLIPTLLYYYSVYDLGSPRGNIDTGAVIGSYFGLILLAGVFTSIGLFASAVTKNQIVAFLAGAFLCFIFFSFFDFISRLPVFVGTYDDIVQKFGIIYHSQSISRGVLDTRDVLYFFSVIVFFLYATWLTTYSRKW